MPRNDQVTLQTYPFTTTVAAQQFSVASKQRVYLLIQNSGANAINVQFGKPNQGQDFDQVILAGDEFEWKEKVPVDGIYISSELGSNGVIVEGRQA